jgi:hypothetical protein
MNEIVESAATGLSPLDIRERIASVEERMRHRPDVMIGDCFPLKHSFAKGLYVRELTAPAGVLAVTKIHKYSHAAFLLKGRVSVIQEDGVKEIEAPAHFITAAGTKRIVYCHTDVVWATVHATEETDLERIEEEIIAKDFDEIGNVIDIESAVEMLSKGDASWPG